jgi:hypothetical protein
VAKTRKLYIDNQGVQRGYYVYVHKEAATGAVFYVGKGHGNRAWARTGRNHLWAKHVDKLGEHWEIEIVADDLSEIEAFELEAELVEQTGGPAACGGSLKNWVPGGEDPASLTINLVLPEPMMTRQRAYFEAYGEARTFKSLSTTEQKEIAESVLRELHKINWALFELTNLACYSEQEEFSNSYNMLLSDLEGLAQPCRDLKNRRISWKEFGLEFEVAKDQLEYAVEQADDYHPAMRDLLNRAADLATAILKEIDSGNCMEAEAAGVKAADEAESKLSLLPVKR